MGAKLHEFFKMDNGDRQMWGIAGVFFQPKIHERVKFGGYFLSNPPLSTSSPIITIGGLNLYPLDSYFTGRLVDSCWGESEIEGKMNSCELSFSKMHYGLGKIETSGLPEEVLRLEHEFDFKFKKHNNLWLGEYNFGIDEIKWSGKANCITFLMHEPFEYLLELPDRTFGMDIRGNLEVIIPEEGDLPVFDEKIAGKAKKGVLNGLAEVAFDLERASENYEREAHLLWIPLKNEWIGTVYMRFQETVAEQMVSWTGPYCINEDCCMKILEAYKIPNGKIPDSEVRHTNPLKLEKIASGIKS